MTRDHYLEVDLGDDAPKSGPLYLIAQGSIHDTESSVNVAITQGNRWRAHGLSVEVPDGRGGWVTAQDNLGFPAGRKKTVLFNLTDIFRPGTPRRVRLRTNLEIYWDAIHWAQGAPDAPLKEATLDPSVADLHYRGYSVMHMPVGAGAPEVPDYNQIEGTKQHWRDLIGYYTRYGDVRELLTQDRRPLRDREFRRRDVAALSRAATATGRLGARLRHQGRWLDQGWRLQFDFLEDRAAAAVSRQERIHDARRASSRMNGCTASIPRTGRTITRAT